MNAATREREWRAQGLWQDQSLGQRMAAAARDHPQTPLHIYSDGGYSVFTLQQVNQRGKSLAASLAQIGIGKGDVVAVQLPNCIENAVLYQATAILGAVLLPIVHIFGPGELNFILADSRAKIFVSPDRWRKIDYLERLSKLQPLPDLLATIIVGGTPPEGALSFAELEAAGSKLPAPVLHTDASDRAMLIYTSGTTGSPKGVIHTSLSLGAELEAQILANSDLDCWLCPWPSGHIAGALGLLGHALLGRPMVIMDAWDPNLAAQIIEKWRVGQLSGTPFHLSGLMKAAKETNHSLKSLKTFVIGATSVPESLIQESEEAGIHCCRCYGSTEVPTVSQSDRSDPAAKRLLTDGSPNAGCEIRIVDDFGMDLPLGNEGELAVRGPEMFVGYTDSGLDTSAFLPGRWFLTGDIGRLDEDGYVTITDRKKDIIIRGGENISSREVEDITRQIAGVADVAAIGVRDERLGERVCVIIVPEDEPPNLQTIANAFSEAGVARQKTPEAIFFVNELHRSPTGKVMKVELRKLAASGKLSSTPAGKPSDANG